MFIIPSIKGGKVGAYIKASFKGNIEEINIEDFE